MSRDEILELFRQLEVEITTEFEGQSQYVTVKLLFDGEVISTDSDMIV